MVYTRTIHTMNKIIGRLLLYFPSKPFVLHFNYQHGELYIRCTLSNRGKQQAEERAQGGRTSVGM